MPIRRDNQKQIIKEARAKMLDSIQENKKRDSLFGNFLTKNKDNNKQEKNKDSKDGVSVLSYFKKNKESKVKKEEINFSKQQEEKRKQLSVAEAKRQKFRADQKAKAREEQKKNIEAKAVQAKKIAKEAEAAKILAIKTKEKAEKEEANRMEVVKRKKAEVERQLLKEKLLAKKKAEKIAFLNKIKEASILAKKRKEEVALKRSEQKIKLNILRAKKRKEKINQLKKEWVSFFKKRNNIKLAKKAQKEKISREREKFNNALKKYKLELSKENKKKVSRISSKAQAKKKLKTTLAANRKARLKEAWLNFSNALVGANKAKNNAKLKIKEKNQLTKQKLHYLKLEKKAREAKLKEQKKAVKSFFGLNKKTTTAPGKKVLKKQKDLIKVSKKELEKKGLSKKAPGFFAGLIKKDSSVDEEQKKKEAKKELEKKAKLKEKEEEGARKEREKELRKIKWSSPEILKANLIRGEVVSYVNWKKNLTILSISILVSAAIIGISYQYLNNEEKQKQIVSESLLEKIDQTNQKIELAKRNVELIVAFQDKISLVSEILNRHIYWTEYFKFLEGSISNDVYLHSFTGGVNGEYSFSASAKNFNTIAEQIKSLRRREDVLLVSTSGGSVAASETGEAQFVDFTIDIELDTNIFLK